MNPTVLSLVRGLHNVSAALWIGGLLILAFVILPVAVRRGGLPLTYSIQDRLRRFVWGAIGILVVTGVLMARMRLQTGHLLSSPGPYQTIFGAKVITVGLMIVLASFRQYLMFRKKVESKAPAVLLFTNVTLGIVTMVLSASLAVVAQSSTAG